MRILHVDAQKEFRGGEQQLILLLKAQIDAGNAVAVACPGCSPLASRAAALGAAHCDFSPSAFFGFWSNRRLRSYASEFKPDIIHAHDSRSVGHLNAAPKGCIRIAHRRVDFPVKSAGKYIRSDAVVSVSSAIQRIVLDCGVPPDRARLIYDGIDPARFASRPSRSELRNQLGLDDRARLILSVGALVDHKAHDTGIRAIERLGKIRSDVTYWIAGDGNLRSALDALASSVNRSLGRDAVCLLGYRDDIPKLLAATDVYYHPSRLEGLGTAVLDAMACGLPVVASRAGGLADAVKDNETGLLADVDSAESHAAALARLLADSGFASAAGKAGAERFQSLFTAQRMANETMALYRELLEKRR